MMKLSEKSIEFLKTAERVFKQLREVRLAVLEAWTKPPKNKRKK